LFSLSYGFLQLPVMCNFHISDRNFPFGAILFTAAFVKGVEASVERNLFRSSIVPFCHTT
jgi:hypothetical protein